MSEIESKVVELAIAAAGVMTDQREWEMRVARVTPVIAAMLRPVEGDDATTPIVTARKVMAAHVFTATFEKLDDSEMERNHRLLVGFKSPTADAKDVEGDGLEWLRTEPRWTRAGFAMQQLVQTLEPGQQCVVHRYNEGFDGQDEKSGRTIRKNSRVLVHLEPRGKTRAVTGAHPPARGAAPPARQSAPTFSPGGGAPTTGRSPMRSNAAMRRWRSRPGWRSRATARARGTPISWRRPLSMRSS